MIRDFADVIVIAPNDRLLDIRPSPSMNAAFEVIDNLAMSALDAFARATV